MEKIAVDFDSAYTNIYKLGSGVVLSEPTVAAISTSSKHEIKAYGVEASKMIGKTAENSKIVFPVFEGEIVNEKVAGGLLQSFFGKIGVRGLLSNICAVVSLPCGMSSGSIEKYDRVLKNSGVSKIIYVEAPLLSALGQHAPLSDSIPCFVVDMAGGTTNVAAVTTDGVIAGVSVNFGNNKIITDIIDYIAEVYGLQIGILTAERLKNEIGSLDDSDGLSTIINGRDIESGAPKSIKVRAIDVNLPIKRYYDRIAEIAMTVIVKLPPEVSAEVRRSGIYVSGRASKVYGLENYYLKKFDMPVHVSENPEYSVALGGGMALGDAELLNKISLKIN